MWFTATVCTFALGCSRFELGYAVHDFRRNLQHLLLCIAQLGDRLRQPLIALPHIPEQDLFSLSCDLQQALSAVLVALGADYVTIPL
jgi:hypothetical protein